MNELSLKSRVFNLKFRIALISEQCYKDAYSEDEAFRMIINGECGVFSPRLMEVFRKVRMDFENLNSHKKSGRRMQSEEYEKVDNTR